MTPKTSPFFLCKARTKPDARCRKFPRCQKCHRVMFFAWGRLCPECEAAANPKTRKCRVCGQPLVAVFADTVCAKCAPTVNVKGGGK